MANKKELKDEELSCVTGGTEICSFKNGKVFNFEIGHYYYSKYKTYIFKVIGSVSYYAADNTFLIPVELYSTSKSFECNANLYVREDDPEYEEVFDF